MSYRDVFGAPQFCISFDLIITIYAFLLIALQEGFRLSQPIFLGFITRYFAEGSQETETNAYLYGLGLALCAMGTSLNMTPLNFLRQRIGMRLRISTSALVYKKVCSTLTKSLLLLILRSPFH